MFPLKGKPRTRGQQLELEDLSLFSNRITQLDGLDNLENLNVLSVGSNAIANLEESVRYLHKLRNNLEVLKIKDNAFREVGEKDYKGRIIAYLKGLKYLDYELIETKERDKAESDYKTELETANLDKDWALIRCDQNGRSNTIWIVRWRRT